MQAVNYEEECSLKKSDFRLAASAHSDAGHQRGHRHEKPEFIPSPSTKAESLSTSMPSSQDALSSYEYCSDVIQ